MAKYHFAVGIARSRPEERKRVPQQGDAEGFERDEVALALFILSINDVQFLKGLRTDPGSTLWRHGFALSPKEMETVRDTFADKEISYLKDEEIIEKARREQEKEKETPSIRATRRWPFW
jgi:hypothetical protein